MFYFHENTPARCRIESIAMMESMVGMERRIMGENYHVARLGWRCLVGLRRCDEGGEAPMMTRSRSRADDGAIARLRNRARWR